LEKLKGIDNEWSYTSTRPIRLCGVVLRAQGHLYLLKGIDYSEDLSVDGRIILKLSYRNKV
jgi:hypothetical protein